MTVKTRSLDLPRLSTSEADALTTLARRAVEIPLAAWPDAGSKPLLSLSLLNDSDPAPALTEPRRFAIEWGGARLYADFPMACVETWLSAYLGGERQTLPAPWREAAAEQACQWLLSTLSSLGRGSAQLAGGMASNSAVTSVPSGIRQRFLVSLQIDAEAQQVIHGILYLDGLALLLAASLLREQAQVVGPIEREALPLVLRFALGESRLELAQLRRLERGDVLFFSHSYLAAEGRLQLVLAGSRGQWWTIGVRVEAESLHIETSIRAMTSQNPANESDSMDEQPVDLDHLPVRLTFDVGERVITLGELEKMQPGETIALGRPLKEAVTIRANGAPVGTGVLVDIDGRLGVRVTRLHAPGNHA